MFESVLGNPWVRALGALLALILTVILIYLLSPVLVPLFFAFIVAYILDPVVDIFEARRISRSVSIAGLAAIGIALFFAVPLFFIPSLIQQADQLTVAVQKEDSGNEGGLSLWFYEAVNRLPLEAIVDSLEAGGSPEDPKIPEPAAPVETEEPQDLPVETAEPPAEVDEDSAGAETPEADAAEADSTEASPPRLASAAARQGEDHLERLTQILAQRVRSGAVAFLQGHGGQIVAAGESGGMGLIQFLTALGKGALSAFLFFGNLALFSFVAAYLLKDYDKIIATAKELVPLGYRDKVYEVSEKIDGQLRSFLRGQLTVCGALALMYYIGLSLSGVPFAFLIAVFGGLASFVPYLGLMLTIGPAIVLCIVQQGGVDGHLLGVFMTFFIAQVLEGTVLTPRIVGEQVGLGPVWVILAILVFGNALGFLGLLLAVPIAASLKVLVGEGIAYYKASPAFGGDDTS